ncbi:hypothetical protein NMY22_g10163 [Coprinellus aureogranulatus]|nr:hypothetical protein NMY22_g10163 [Coprinellus aureogranulatus]
MFNDVRDVHIGEANQVNARRYHDSSSTIVQPGGHHTTHTEVKARTYIHNEISKTAMTTLSSNAVLEALHNSDERCDAPACFPETRKAVQEDIMSWITNGDNDDDPKKIMWLHGPAGSGKTAIAGSIAETCEDLGILAGSFFFSSYAGSGERSCKRGVVATLAYSLLQHDGLDGVRESILTAIERDPSILRKRLRDQCKRLLLKPFHDVGEALDPSSLPQVIILDGIDEIEAQGSRAMERHSARAANERDQNEVLAILLQAAHDPKFPFRILIVSRPERIIQEFFSGSAKSVSRELCLDEKYDPDSDIALFLQAKLSEIRRRFRLPASWASNSHIDWLVTNASGQFIYADIVVRFLDSGKASPRVKLDSILGLDSCQDLKPFKPLDALYTHILNQSPDPVLAVQWVSAIQHGFKYEISAFCLQNILQEEVGQANYLLDYLSSLVRIPPADNLWHSYKLYHKSFVDFLLDSTRSGAEWHESFTGTFLVVRFACMLLDKIPVVPMPELHLKIFWAQFVEVMIRMRFLTCEIVTQPSRAEYLSPWLMKCDVAWWIETATATPYTEEGLEDSQDFVAGLYQTVHWDAACGGGCVELCKHWRSAIHRACATWGWNAPDASFLLRERMHYSASDVWSEARECFVPRPPYFQPAHDVQAPEVTAHADYASLLCLADAMYCRLPSTWKEDYHLLVRYGGTTKYNIFEPLIEKIKYDLEVDSSPSTRLCYPPDTVLSADTVYSIPLAFTSSSYDLPSGGASDPPSDPALDAFIESIVSFD